MVNLALKYRPATFNEVVGQDEIVSILDYQIKTHTTKNSYLFTGPSGCGKTTVARIFANVINNYVGTPIEIDAATNTGVDNVRNIVNEASFKSIATPFKVFIIDECHMLSMGAWNALLKLLEEPPAHCVIILCTTDPQKVPITILTRVQRFDFGRIPDDIIVERLKLIVEGEKTKRDIVIDDESLYYIAEKSNGGMRTAIGILDKCLDMSLTVDTELIVNVLGIINDEILYNLFFAITNKYYEGVFKELSNLYIKGKDLKILIKNLISVAVHTIKQYLVQKLDVSVYTALLEELVFLSNDIKYESDPYILIQASFILFMDRLK